MSNQLLPELGSSGAFKFRPPFDKLLGSSTSYTCKSIRKISELLSKSEPVLENYYLKYGLTSNDYSVDMQSDIALVGLFSAKGVWFYVPASFILSYPDSTGVAYRRMMMGVELGPIPENFDLNPVSEAVIDIVYKHIGIRPEIKNVVISQKVLLSSENHQAIENTRRTKQLVDKPMTLIIDELTRERDEAFLKIKELERYIKTRL